MKASFKILISVLALGVMASTPLLRAQAEKAPQGEGRKGGGPGGGRGQMSPEERIAGLEKAVGSLSEEQKTKITGIIAKSRESMQGLSQEDRRTKGRELMQAERDQIRAVLTADQQAKFDAMPQGRGPGGGGQGKKKKDGN